MCKVKLTGYGANREKNSYFVAYEVMKKRLTPAGSTDLSLPAVMAAGAFAGVAMWSIAIPPDVIKSRLQSAPNGTYNGFTDCVRKTIKADGVGALWKGFSAAMARAIPANVSLESLDVVVRPRGRTWQADALLPAGSDRRRRLSVWNCH